MQEKQLESRACATVSEATSKFAQQISHAISTLMWTEQLSLQEKCTADQKQSSTDIGRKLPGSF